MRNGMGMAGLACVWERGSVGGTGVLAGGGGQRQGPYCRSNFQHRKVSYYDETRASGIKLRN